MFLMIKRIPKSFIIIILIFQFGIHTAYAGIKGTIRDNEGSPLAGATIVVCDNNNKMITYTTSGSDGTFNIEIELSNQAYYLVVRLIGFLKEKVTINGNDDNINVILSQDNVSLKEVVVKASPIRQVNDTTRYVVASFMDGHEKNVEELLMKLPGIDVSENGNITFKGKSISKILLDNSDMFGSNYKTASRTIPPQFVSTIEAINHYQENRQLKGVQTSDDVVLNLSLRSDMKLQKPVGQINLGGGIENRYDIGGNLMTMNKRVKFFDSTNLSNITSSDLFSIFELEKLSPIEVVTDYFQSFTDRDNIKYSEQKSVNNSLNMLFQPTSRLTFKEQLIIECNHFSTENKEIIRYTDNLTTIDHKATLKKSPWCIYNSIEAKYDWNKATTLTIHNILGYNDNKVNNHFIEDYVDNYNLRSKSVLIDNSFNLSHSLNSSSAIVVEMKNLIRNGHQLFNYNSSIYQLFEADRFNTDITAKYYNKREQWEWNVETGYIHKVNKIQSNICNVTSTFSNYYEYLLYANPKASWTSRNIKLQFGMLMGYWLQNIKSSTIGDDYINKVKIVPDLLFEWDFKKHHFSLSSSYEPKNMDPLNYISYYSDYRQLSQSAGFYNHDMAELGITSSYMYTPSLGTMLMAVYMISNSKNEFIYHYKINEDMELAIPTSLSANKKQLGILSFTKYYDALRHGLKLSLSYNSMDYKNMIENGGIRSVNSRSLISKLYVRSSFGGQFNYVLGGRYGLTSYHVKGNDKMTSHVYSVFQELFYKKDHLKIRLAFDEHFLGKNHNFYFFISPDIRYDLKKYNATISLCAYNVLNNKNIHEYLLTDIYSREYKQDIVPAYYLLNISFRY